jgi:CBS domain-containing protein
MEEHQVRRFPVIEEHRLVGIVHEADVARHLPVSSAGTLAPKALVSNIVGRY